MQQDKKRRDANLFVNCRLVDRSTIVRQILTIVMRRVSSLIVYHERATVSCELFSSAMSHGIDIHRSSKYICCEEHR